MSEETALQRLTEPQLHARVHAAATDARRSCVALLRLLLEVDRRRSYLAHGAPSLFAYCTRQLRMGEAEAYLRITAARTARRFPVLFGLLESGELHLTSAARLSPHLTEDNHVALLEAARHRSQREIQRLVADFASTMPRRPRVEVVVESAPTNGESPPASLTIAFESEATEIRTQDPAVPGMESPGSGNRPPAAAAPDRHRPDATSSPRVAIGVGSRSPTRYRLHVTIPQSAMRKLDVLTELMRHQVPDGDPAAILERGLDLLLEAVGRRKFGLRKRDCIDLAGVSAGCGDVAGTVFGEPRAPGDPPPRPSPTRRGRIRRGRGIPAAVRRAVRNRDAGQCAFRAADGQRCPARAWLEYHHVVPFARGGSATVENIELRCRAHNLYEARRDFGARAMGEPPADSEPPADG